MACEWTVSSQYYIKGNYICNFSDSQSPNVETGPQEP